MGFYTEKNKRHNYGDYEKLSKTLLGQLELLAAHLGQELLITSGYRPGGSSQHRLGLAVDVVPSRPIELLDLWIAAERFGFSGLGVYPDWSNGAEVTGGLHLDVRITNMGARWIGVRNAITKKNVYLGLTKATLKQVGAI